MSYVAQLTLTRADAARRGLHGLYEWHNLSWKCFPEKKEDDKRDFLTRIDTTEHECCITILSKQKPSIPYPEAVANWKEREIPVSFYSNNRYLFKVYANPTKTLSRRDPKGNKKKYGSHYALLKVEELRTWIKEKAEQNGFRILSEPELEITPPVFHKLYRKGDEGTIVGVEFKGSLEVTDKNAFQLVASEGIGRARGLGFGMLVLKPIL